jgi:hypothetical protein
VIKIFGFGALISIFAFQIAWIAQSAQRRGRNPLAWVAIGLAVGGLGLTVGVQLYRWATGGDDPNAAAIVAGLLAIPVSILVPLITTALVLGRLPVRVGRSREWQVHVMNRGPGSLRIEGESVHLAWPDVSRVVPAPELRGVQVDGECVRFETASGDAFVLMPRGGPDHRDGRIAQSKALAGALVALGTRERT